MVVITYSKCENDIRVAVRTVGMHESCSHRLFSKSEGTEILTQMASKLFVLAVVALFAFAAAADVRSRFQIGLPYWFAGLVSYWVPMLRAFRPPRGLCGDVRCDFTCDFCMFPVPRGR